MKLTLKVLRIVVVLLLGYALYSALVFISIDSFRRYTEVGTRIGLASIVLFAVWAWWYGEDRDRRRAARALQRDGRAVVDGDGR